MKQTAIEWLGKKLESYGDPQYCKLEWKKLDLLIKKAKAMEKKQMIDAFWNGDNTNCIAEQNAKEFAEKYYNETFKK